MSFLKQVKLDWQQVEQKNQYPFNLPALANLSELSVDQDVTFFVGENGTGKSTLLEAIAHHCGFGNRGGGIYKLVEKPDKSLLLEDILTLSWFPKVTQGFFLRAETFFDFANYIDELAKEEPSSYAPYGGRSLHENSHGEAFLTLFTHRFNSKGIYILDEPEAALSPQRQLAFLRIIHDLIKAGKAQFIIATHSPIIMAYPGACIYSFDRGSVQKVDYEDTEHYRLTKAFLNSRQACFEELFKE